MNNRKGKLSVEDIWLNDLLKLVNCMTSDKNNGHHFTGQMSKATVPSGMKPVGFTKHDRVLVKSMSSVDLTKERISETVELLREHIHVMQEDLGER